MSIKYFFTTHKYEILLTIVLLVIAGVAHGFNMLHYPYYESDEGTYLAQAWAILNNGQLAPYTYWYDHSPAGWIFLSLWTLLTGGVFTFGFSINSGRVFMLLLHLASAVFLYLIGKKITGSKMVGALSLLFFSLSPLGIYFQRRILLDNIMVFWVLLTFAIILYSKQRLSWIIASAMTFGIAVLSKENAIFFYPLFMYLVWTGTNAKNRLFGFISWMTISASIISLYFLYALLKGEFFPSGTLLGGQNEHVSLLGTLDFQANRGKVSILSSASTFWKMFATWQRDDAIILYLGIATGILTLIAGIKQRSARIVGVFALSYWAFLMRGGLVLEFYVIPLIPVMALCIGYVFGSAYAVIKKFMPRPMKILAYTPVLMALGILIYTVVISSNQFRGRYSIYFSDQTTAQKDAVAWVLNQKLPNDFYVIDMYAYLDLNLKNNHNFANAEYYWKVDGDKDIREKVLQSNPYNIDYILFTPLIGGDLGTGELPMTGLALANANPITSFEGDGWYVQMWGVKNKDRVLSTSWETYKKSFIENGRTYDDRDEDFTTSEAQSYALLRSVWMNDKKSFDTVLNWSTKHLLQENGLHAWKYKNGSVIDDGFAPDADQDIALALLFAYKKWQDPQYLKQAQSSLNAIWNESVVVIRNKPYLVAGSWADRGNEIIVNPSYFSPAAYKIFAEVDKKHNWLALSETSYDLLATCTNATLGQRTGVLPPEWCAINKTTLRASQPTGDVPQGTEYGYNAFRIPWRIGLDYEWHKDTRAKEYLSSLSFLQDEWIKNKKIPAVYTHSGDVFEEYETASVYAGNLAYFSILYPAEAKTIYEQKILSKLYEDKDRSYWEDPKNYYTQNWAWFGTALYTNNLPNLWKNQ